MTTERLMEPPTLPLDVAVDMRCPAWSTALPAAEGVCRSAAAAALACAGVVADNIEISVVLADDDFIRNLNREWRDKDVPTNVLAFPCEEEPGSGDDVWLLGDVIVALETTQREAAGEGKPLGDHLSHLIVHGVLHLLGYDHLSDDDANEMEGLEIVALDRLGIENPYGRVSGDARHPVR